MRPLHAVAIAASVSALAIAPSAASAAPCIGADLAPTAATLATVEQATLCLLNEQRAAAGLAPVTRNAELDQASRAHSADMVARKYFAHDAPDGSGFLARVRRVGYVTDSLRSWNAGENIAWGSGSLAPASAIMVAWMNSQRHRENILDGAFKEIGIGVATGVPVAASGSAGATYTTDFGARVAGSTSGTTTRPVSHKAKAKTKVKRCRRGMRATKAHGRKKSRCVAVPARHHARP